jgi:TolB-like protein/Flp pilus assembly protein TadD
MSPRHPAVPASAATPSATEISQQLDRLTASEKLRSSERLCRFLRFVVEKAVSGAGDEIKEYSVATIVYGRPSSFDPKTDSIVRVEASRLRSKLREYYDSEGLHDLVVVELPKGAYVPAFTRRSMAEAVEWSPEPVVEPATAAIEPQPSPRPNRSRLLMAAGSMLLVSIISLSFYRSRSASAPTNSDLSAVAVLPFVVLNTGSASADLSRGLAEDVAHALSQSKQIRVAGPASVAGVESLPLLRKQLHVGSVLQGSIRQSQNKVRINAQLVSTLDGYHLWSAAYERDYSTLAGFQSGLAQTISSEVLTNLTKLVADAEASAGREAEALTFFRNGSILLDWNYDHLLAGSESAGLPELATLRKAVQYFEQAVTLNPGYARAHSALAHSYAVLADGDATLAAKARASAIRAIQLDDGLASAHAVLGYIKFLHDWDFAGAEAEFRRALEQQPRLLGLYRLYGDCASMLDHHQAALSEVESGSAIFPDSRILAVTRTIILFHTRRYDQMAREARALQERHPGYAPAHWLLGLALEQQGSADAAIEQFEQVHRLTKGDRRAAIALGHVRAVQGQRAEALKVIESFRTQSPAGSNAPYAMALLYTGLGEREQAFHWLNEAYSRRDNSLPYMKIDPRFDPIRTDRRFEELLAKLRLK